MGGKSSKPAAVDNDAAVRVDETKKEETKVSDDSSTSADQQEQGGGCPMKRDDCSYSYNWGGLFGGKRPPHGPKGPANESSTSTDTTKEEGGCPVKHQEKPQEQGGCPVKQQEYNVYSQPINPKNQMPNLNQLPSPQQKESLSTERVPSTIPKGGTSATTWTYPSPQMFYNALARKGKLDNTEEQDIPSVVALHNNMNEKTWQKVLQWEEVLSSGKESPKLLKFMGRPSDLSPKARFKHWVLGHPLPFDRHDWTIVRGDGTTVRYVIDYYYDETQASESPDSGMPDMHDAGATPSLLVDVRPALDGPSAALGRCIYMPYARNIEKSTPFTPMPLLPTSELKTQVTESVQVWDNIQKAKQPKAEKEPQEEEQVSSKEAVELAQSFASILKDCRQAQEKLNAAESESDIQKASMDLQMCMAKIVCPLQHGAVVQATQSNENDKDYHVKVEAALENMAVCVAAANHKTVLAKRSYPEKFESLET